MKPLSLDREKVLVPTLRTAVVEITHVWLPVDWINTPISSTLWAMNLWLRVVVVTVCVRLEMGSIALARIGIHTGVHRRWVCIGVWCLAWRD